MNEKGEFDFAEQVNPYTEPGWDHQAMEEETMVRPVVELVFPKWSLPIQLVLETFPVDGKGARKIFFGWVHQERLSISLPEGCNFPLSCKAFRRPVRLGEHVRKGGVQVKLNDPATWPRYAQWSGIEHQLVFVAGKARALCTHKPRCPVTLDFPGGVIYDGDTPWVMPHDKETMRETDYMAVMQEEARKLAAKRPVATKAAGVKKEVAPPKAKVAAPKPSKEAIRAKIGTPKDIVSGGDLAEKIAAATKAAPVQKAAAGKE